MNATSKVVGLMVLLASAACASEATPSQDAPETTLEGVDGLDTGTSYNGWTQSLGGYKCQQNAIWTMDHTLTRSSGDATRGGGGCGVIFAGGSCTTDDVCITGAQSTWGSSAWGYCYGGTCYHRPGSQASFCALNPNRTAGTLEIFETFTSPAPNGFIGCMTKTVGPNTSCGCTTATCGANYQSLYMRTLMSSIPTISCS